MGDRSTGFIVGFCLQVMTWMRWSFRKGKCQVFVLFFFVLGGYIFVGGGILDFRKAWGFIYESWSLQQIKWIIRNIDQSTRSADKLRTHPQTRTKQHCVFVSQVTSPTPEPGEWAWILGSRWPPLYNWSKYYSYEIQGFSEEEGIWYDMII